jgi:hypothetical protein
MCYNEKKIMALHKVICDREEIYNTLYKEEYERCSVLYRDKGYALSDNLLIALVEYYTNRKVDRTCNTNYRINAIRVSSLEEENLLKEIEEMQPTFIQWVE